MSDLWQQLNGEIAHIVTGIRRSLVQINNGRGGAGAGTVWHADGLIVTNAHVVAGRHSFKVTLPDKQVLPARLLAADPEHDLAALSVDSTGLPTIALGESRQLHPGQLVVAMGHPWGVLGAVTAGTVITVGTPPEIGQGQGEFIQVGLHLRPGYSGGPLVDVHGRLVGINTMVAGPDVGLAIPLHVVKSFLKDALGTPKPAVPPAEYI